jgi:nucleotide-binding universal stress UspA family protein
LEAETSRAGSGQNVMREKHAASGYKKILVCYDGSENSTRALQRGIVIAKETGGEMYVVVAADTYNIQARYLERYYSDLRKIILHDCKNDLAEALDVSKRSGLVGVRGSLEEGHPAEVILAKASEVDADLIVLGRRGLRGVQRFLLGSVSSSVVSHSTCDVLVVK